MPELGWSRFAVECTGVAATDEAVAPASRRPAPHERMPYRDPVADPFGVLDLAGARRRPSADLVTSLLHDGPPPPRPDESWPGGGRRSSPCARPADGCALFAQWHEEFERAVRDPHSLAGRAEWQQLPADGAPAPTLAQLGTLGRPCSSLLDILRVGDCIDRMIEGFDRLDGPDLLAFEPPADVLAAFAPELVRPAGVELPGLTRREHHAIATDSPVRMGAGLDGEEGAAV